MKQHKEVWLNVAGLTLAGLMLVAGCGRDESKGRSMIQVYREKGFPVRISQVQKCSFAPQTTYFAALSGSMESNAGAPIGGTVQRIHYRVGDTVKKDAVVVSFPSDSPATQYFQARVAFNLARTTLERIEKLHAVGGVSRQELDTVRTRYEVARANWEAAQQSVHVRAPITGIITQISVRESDAVEEKTLLFTVAHTDRLRAEVWVNEDYIAHIQSGDRAVAEWNHVVLEGRVTRVNRAVNPMRQAFGVTAEFDNPDQKVLLGVNAAVTLFTSEQSEGVCIGRESIGFENGQPFVFVVKDGHAVRRAIRIGRNIGMMVEVPAGLEAQETIVSEGLMLLEDGSPIHIINAAAAQTAAGDREKLR